MKQIALIFAVALVAAPVHAEDGPKSEPLLPSEEEMKELGRMAEGWMRLFADQMSPMMERLKTIVDDLDRYEAPEVMSNGDIIIRRKLDDQPERADDEESIAL
ncbi:MAG: AAA+ family ATPase [Pseudomonadota bacterium]